MTKILLGALVCAMLALTGVVAYSHFAVDPSVASASDETSGCCSQKSTCSSCSACCTHELPVESAGCTECSKAKAAAAAEATKAEVKEEASEPK